MNCTSVVLSPRSSENEVGEVVHPIDLIQPHRSRQAVSALLDDNEIRFMWVERDAPQPGEG